MIQGRLGTRYDALARHAQATRAELAPSGGGWFLAPNTALDPRLFTDGDRLSPDVRQELLSLLHGFWAARYADAESWSTAWIAGSQITRQWREEGDLDVLIGIDMPGFLKANPAFKGFSESIVARHLNKELREELWPQTEHWRGWAEVTFYVNPKTGNDIRNIHPYAAYNLTTDAWDVPPPDLPEDWSEAYVPEQWVRQVHDEIDNARDIVDRYNRVRGTLDGDLNEAERVNVGHQLNLIVAQAADLYEAIHGERRRAFQGEGGMEGKGFFDYHNYRWQAHKQAGTVKALSTIAKVAKAAEVDALASRYGLTGIEDQITPENLPRWYR